MIQDHNILFEIPTLQQRGLEILRHEAERNNEVPDAQALAVHPGEGYLLLVMFAAVVEGYGKGYTLFVIVEHCDGVYASTDYKDRVFHFTVHS